MYNIAICDDQIICGETLELSLIKILKDFDVAYNIDIYTSGNDLLDVIKNKKVSYDILFLDIIMGDNDLNGMQLAKLIRNVDDFITIVFVTSSADFVFDGYSVRALQYLIKPIDEKVLKSLMEYELKDKTEDFIIFKEKEATRKVTPSSIVHIETSGRNVKVVLQDEEFNAINKISDIEKELPESDFIRCHQSFIININNIKELRHGEAISVREDSIPISRTQWSATKKLFIEKN